MQVRQSRLTDPEEERICVFFTTVAKYPRLQKRRKGYGVHGFKSIVNWFHCIQACGQAEIPQWKSVVGKSVHVVRREEGNVRRRRRRKESWNKLPLPFIYPLPTAFKDICLLPPSKPYFLFYHHIMNTSVGRSETSCQPKNLRPGIRIP